jgi:MFS family permease
MADHRSVPVWRATLSGLCANLVGVGLARFAYTPIIPVLIAAQWFVPSQAAYLGAANLAGYLAGALLARPLVARYAPAAVLRAVMLLTAASFFACAHPLSFAWFFGWRFVAGFGGGALMVVAAPAIMPHVPASQRGIVSGAIFAGVGLGIAASGTLVALLLRQGLVETWYSLGTLALLLTAAAWSGWPRRAGAPASGAAKARGVRASATLRALYVEYGLSAVGLVPHMVFLVDFIARGRGLGIELGARYWVLFGVSAIAGPVLLGFAADRIGFRLMLRLAFAVDAAAIALALVDAPLALAASSMIVGASVSGVVPLALGRVRELVHDEALQRHAWSTCTVAFAVGQAVAAYGFSYVFAQTDGAYVALFAIGAGAFALALALDLGAAVVSRLVRRSGVANGSPQ